VHAPHGSLVVAFDVDLDEADGRRSDYEFREDASKVETRTGTTCSYSEWLQPPRHDQGTAAGIVSPETKKSSVPQASLSAQSMAHRRRKRCVQERVMDRLGFEEQVSNPASRRENV